jgi:class 3 adenylate cyclase
MMDEGTIYGDGVNLASRLESLATPGSILVSEKVFDEIKNQEDIRVKRARLF